MSSNAYACNRPGCPHFPAGICPAAPCGPNGNRLPANSFGYSTQPYQNPMELHDDQGWGVPFTQHPTFMPPVFLNVESARRDTTLYPDADSFRLHLPHKLSGIRSIEVVDLYIPSAEVASIPADDYFFLYNGLKQNGSYAPQGVMKMYETLNMERQQLYNVNNTIANNVEAKVKTPNEPISSEYYAPEVTLNASPSSRPGAGSFPTPYTFPDFGSNSFGKFRYESTLASQSWERSNWRRVQYFKPELSQLSFLDFSLVDRLSVAYALPADTDWSATIMVTARSK